MKHLLLLLLSFLGLTAYAQPEVKLDSTKFNLGQIIQRTPLMYDIWVTNSGNEPLIITRASTSDGGSMATYDSQPILPGKKGKIQFIYDTKRIGPFSRSLTIQSNDPEVYAINIKGEVVYDPMPISVSTREIDLGEIEYDSIAYFSFRVSTAGKKPVHFTENRGSYFQYDLFNLETKSTDSTNEYFQNLSNEFEVKGQIINKYGNSGKFSHQIPFIYNSHDTLYIAVKGKFVSKKPVVTHNEFVFREATARYIYENSCLKEVIHYNYQGKVSKRYVFEGSNCVKLEELITYPDEKYKTTEFVDGKPIKVQ